jgi:hypothetical protein
MEAGDVHTWVLNTWICPNTGCITNTPTAALPANQSAPGSRGEPLREYGCVVAATIGNRENMASPLPTAPLETRWVRMQSRTSSNATHPWNSLTNGRWSDRDARTVSKSLATNSSCRQTMSYGAVDRKLAMALILLTRFFEIYFNPLSTVRVGYTRRRFTHQQLRLKTRMQPESDILVRLQGTYKCTGKHRQLASVPFSALNPALDGQ